ncbi:MAG: fumarate hydratase C-terminal domain-containing protein [Eggerthellaceae bacterium]|nr:fumarate hydratase C-terminal domain-containing protein [Eggerthellaceae bacterium]
MNEKEDSVQRVSSGASAPAKEPIQLQLPLEREQLVGLHAGDACLLSGAMYTLRDAGHVRLLGELSENYGVLPYGLEGQTIFYAGPTPEVDDRPFGAVGPTTASRMDFAAVTLHDAGIVATIGKGKRSLDVREACVRNGCVYFTATGGAAALLAKQVKSSVVVAYDDLGTEALRRVEVEDFPVFVAIDTQGNNLFDQV